MLLSFSKQLLQSLLRSLVQFKCDLLNKGAAETPKEQSGGESSSVLMSALISIPPVLSAVQLVLSHATSIYSGYELEQLARFLDAAFLLIGCCFCVLIISQKKKETAEVSVVLPIGKSSEREIQSYSFLKPHREVAKCAFIVLSILLWVNAAGVGKSLATGKTREAKDLSQEGIEILVADVVPGQKWYTIDITMVNRTPDVEALSYVEISSRITFQLHGVPEGQIPSAGTYRIAYDLDGTTPARLNPPVALPENKLRRFELVLYPKVYPRSISSTVLTLTFRIGSHVVEVGPFHLSYG